jgi:hypothetical protein
LNNLSQKEQAGLQNCRANVLSNNYLKIGLPVKQFNFPTNDWTFRQTIQLSDKQKNFLTNDFLTNELYEKDYDTLSIDFLRQAFFSLHCFNRAVVVMVLPLAGASGAACSLWPLLSLGAGLQPRM